MAAVLGTPTWEAVDTLGHASWVRRIRARSWLRCPTVLSVSYLRSFVLQPAADMVIHTLEGDGCARWTTRAVRDAGVYSTTTPDDEALWRPVEGVVRKEHDVKFVHLSNWPGYKSGALDYTLRTMRKSSCN